MRQNIWYWTAKQGKWYWAVRAGKKLSRALQCGKKVLARCKVALARRLAALRTYRDRFARVRRRARQLAAALATTVLFSAAPAIGGQVVLFDNLNAQWPSGIDTSIAASTLPTPVFGRAWTPADGYQYSWPAREFTTDASAYSLNTVTLDFRPNSSSNTAVPELDIYSDANDAPGQLVAHIAAPDLSAGFPQYGEFTASGVTLAPNSAYWAVLKASDNGIIGWAISPDSSGSGVGFTTNAAYSLDAGTTWTTENSSFELMQVVATPIPEPSAIGLFAAFATIASGAFALRSVLARCRALPSGASCPARISGRRLRYETLECRSLLNGVIATTIASPLDNVPALTASEIAAGIAAAPVVASHSTIDPSVAAMQEAIQSGAAEGQTDFSGLNNGHEKGTSLIFWHLESDRILSSVITTGNQ
jgi:hypothetical protein